MIGSLSMLILDKRKDIQILFALGADNKLVRKIFMTEGILVTLTGAIAGIALGTLILVMQQKFGFVKINAEGGSFLISAYPVDMHWKDYISVFLVVSGIGFLATLIPVAGIRKIKNEQPERDT
jgi:lipoprotein-releasing system permease protein